MRFASATSACARCRSASTRTARRSTTPSPRWPGRFDRSIAAIRFLKAQGLRVLIANVLMRQNAGDYPGVQALAAELGAEFTLDPTITPKMDGDTSLLAMRIPTTHLLQVFTDKSLIGDSITPPPGAPDLEAMDDAPCSAGHAACYVSPVRRHFSVRAVPVAERQPAARTVRGHLAALQTARRGSRHPPPRFADLLGVQPPVELHAVPGVGLHGGKHARAVLCRLRKVARVRSGEEHS